MRNLLLLVLLLTAAAWPNPTLGIVASSPHGIIFAYSRLNMTGKPMEVYGSGIGGKLEITRDGTLVDTVEVLPREDGARRVVKPGEVITSTRFTWKGGPTAPAGRYVARLVDGPELAFQLPLTKAGMKVKSSLPPRPTERLLLGEDASPDPRFTPRRPPGFCIVYEARNGTKSPMTVAHLGTGPLVIARGKKVVASLLQPRRLDPPRQVVAPGAVAAQVWFSWPAAAQAAPGEYTAKLGDLEIKFRLPRK